MAENEDINQR